MPVTKPVEEEREQIFLPSTKDEPNVEDRRWVVMDISPAMGKDLVTVERRDSAGVTLLKGVLSRLKEWNLYQEGTKAWPINLETMQTLLTIEEINFLSDQIKSATATKQLGTDEKKA